MPHGHGEFQYGADGDKKISWILPTFNIFKGKEGERYTGQYERGFRTGYGTYYYSDGRSFVGTFLNDQREGPGIMYYPRGFRREGTWVLDKLLGEVRKYMDNETILEIWLEDGIYVGGAVNKVPHGEGTITYFEDVPSLQNYTGEWREGVKQGFGKMNWKDGDRYRGDWRNDLPEGKGEYQWANGNKFVGQFHQGLPSGEGVFETRNGDVFVGNLRNGLPSGKGKISFHD